MPVPLTQTVAGPTGWITMGEVEVGTVLFDEQGQPTTVTAVFEVTPTVAYRLTFADGATVDACGDHQWVTLDILARKALNRRGDPIPADWAAKPPITTQQIVDSLTYGPRNDRNHCIPLTLPLVTAEQRLPLDPWVLGYWLGNGSLHTSSVSMHAKDEVYVRDRLRRRTGPSFKGTTCPQFTIYGLQGDLRAIDVLDRKHVPAVYLRASITQRRDLLAGLLDSDGHMDQRGMVEFSSKDRRLSEAVVELARSLGYKATLRTTKASLNGKRMADRHRVCWRASQENPFQSPRKTAMWPGPSKAQALRNQHRMIVSAKPIPPVPMRCVTVDSPNHMYLVSEGMIPTHNTMGSSRYVNAHALGPPCDPRLPGGHRILIVAPTMGDGVESCVRGPSGLLMVNPTTRLVGGAGGLSVHWPNGVRARILGAYGPEDVERLRAGGGNCLVWMEEMAAQRHLGDALTHTSMGLRIGASPHYVASTTPKPRPEIRELLANPTTVLTRGKTQDAVRLDPTVLASYLEKYEGTRQGRQELDAELLDDVEGALWTLTMIDTDRHKGPMPPMEQVVVGVDPPGSSTGKGNAEAGIIVAGRAARGWHPPDWAGGNGQHGFVIADLSGKMTPEEWGRVAVDAFWRYNATTVAVETAYGGEMVLSTIRTIDDSVPVKKMPTKVGKRLRAEPVVSLYEQHRVSHIGILSALEDQMCTWVPGETTTSPDRVDALTHAMTYLLVRGGEATASVPQGTRRAPGRRPVVPSRAAALRRMGG